MKIEKIKIESLNPAKYNPRKDLKPGDLEYEKLKRSIVEFGYIDPIIWNERTGNIIGGHQRYKVLKDQGVKELDCVVLDIDETREKALNVALNKINGEWDELKLSELIVDLNEELFDVSLTGFDAAEMEEMLNKFQSKESTEDDFDFAAEKERVESDEPITKMGGAWQLGQNRLICGDSKDIKTYEKLFGNSTAQVCVTSPPYGVGKEYEEKGVAPWLETVEPVINNICKYSNVVCWNLGDLYITQSQFIVPTNAYSINMFNKCGFNPIWIRIWKKQGMNFGLSPYHLVTNKVVQQYEYISAFAKPDHKFVKRLNQEENKSWGYAGIWEINTVRSNKEHPAMFPVELPWRCIKMHSDKGDIVLEPFCGSGTTIIAAEQTQRKCYAIEISPIYCDLAVARWEKFTCKKAVKSCKN